MELYFEVLFKQGDNKKILLKIEEENEYGCSYMSINIDMDVNQSFISNLSENEYDDYSTMISNLELISESPLTIVDKKTIKTILNNLSQKFNLEVSNKHSSKETVSDSKLTFKSVVGMNEVKEKLFDVIDQFNNPEKYKAWNVKPIKSVLFYGPPGTGKSFISEALANELDKDVTFIKKSCGDLIDKYLGQTGKNIISLFEEARKAKFAVLYMDEIDALASKRSSDDNNKERNAALNELLIQMAAPENQNIFMIFATNMMNILDPAFLRSGRCDFKIEIPLPDFECRKGILEMNSKGRPLSEDVDFVKLSRNMSGMNCADMTNVANEAARRAIKAKKDCIEQIDFENAFEEMICGVKSSTTKLEEHEKNVVAVHETGHLLANEFYKLDKTKKISILPRGNTLGYVLHANEDKDDKFLQTHEDLINRIKMILAGRAAEELIFGEVTTGSCDDLEKANKIAKNIVCNYGFSEEFGLRIVDKGGKESNEIINNILVNCYNEVLQFLTHSKETLIRFSNVLKEKEEMNSEEIYSILEMREVAVIE